MKIFLKIYPSHGTKIRDRENSAAAPKHGTDITATVPQLQNVGPSWSRSSNMRHRIASDFYTARTVETLFGHCFCTVRGALPPIQTAGPPMNSTKTVVNSAKTV